MVLGALDFLQTLPVRPLGTGSSNDQCGEIDGYQTRKTAVLDRWDFGVVGSGSWRRSEFRSRLQYRGSGCDRLTPSDVLRFQEGARRDGRLAEERYWRECRAGPRSPRLDRRDDEHDRIGTTVSGATTTTSAMTVFKAAAVSNNPASPVNFEHVELLYKFTPGMVRSCPGLRR